MDPLSTHVGSEPLPSRTVFWKASFIAIGFWEGLYEEQMVLSLYSLLQPTLHKVRSTFLYYRCLPPKGLQDDFELTNFSFKEM